ncbi:hypothetical protein [Loigolactobacillus jiayinensis]|uniref:Uncharacterized protein n=1 Tax=Loigolactobacillus jiayinensis TaxID=2486016 RepID=A0ABW1REU4_9LACO|nr:hypothetical protein [Loigolactobacillus jiayinensis]
MDTVKFYFWRDQKDNYCKQLTTVIQMYYKTKIDQSRLAVPASDANLVNIEVTMHLYTHILLLAQQWQQQVQDFLTYNLAQQKLTPAQFDYRTSMRLFGVLLTNDMAQAMNVVEMQQLYYLAEVIKSGSSTAAQQLREIRPDYFCQVVDPLDLASNTLHHLDIFTSLYENQAELQISELDLLDFDRLTQQFWQRMPETLTVERDTLVMLLK